MTANLATQLSSAWEWERFPPPGDRSSLALREIVHPLPNVLGMDEYDHIQASGQGRKVLEDTVTKVY